MSEKQLRRRKRRQLLFDLAATVLQSASVGCSMLYYFAHSPHSSSSVVAGVRCVLFAASLVSYVLWFAARVQLGSKGNLTVLARSNGPLITTGLYSRLRNPIYVFGTVALTTYLLAISRAWYLLVLLVLVPLQLFRSFVEAKVLRRKFDEQYEEYIKRVWM
ncbi:hypothetical protein B484DRAFT_397198 [Ochromonadaceae sp. CCMP2298]|nr:hypothetical protein B484DRAFT_397198 [Ochromonadaceae sp. CCMP2298]|mmetsp:Transcript_20217/g.44959  ORF Transcript_20217/g.44959 Transcript_20217/m.44959 type:complete len:161 (+) Transcript_20217:363-845(+)